MLNFVLVCSLLTFTLTYILVVIHYSIKNSKSANTSLSSTVVIYLCTSIMAVTGSFYLIPQDVNTQKFLLVNIEGEGFVTLKEGIAKANVYHEGSEMLGYVEVHQDSYEFNETDKESYAEYKLHKYNNMFLDAIFGMLTHDSLTVYHNEEPNQTALLSCGILYPPGYSKDIKEENDKLINELNKLEDQLRNEAEERGQEALKQNETKSSNN